MSNTPDPNRAIFEAWYDANRTMHDDYEGDLEVWRAAVSAERERIKAKLLDRHSESARLHNYYACMAVELFGPIDDFAEHRVTPNVQPAADAR
jgi:hypothetical protein